MIDVKEILEIVLLFLLGWVLLLFIQFIFYSFQTSQARFSGRFCGTQIGHVLGGGARVEVCIVRNGEKQWVRFIDVRFLCLSESDYLRKVKGRLEMSVNGQTFDLRTAVMKTAIRTNLGPAVYFGAIVCAYIAYEIFAV